MVLKVIQIKLGEMLKDRKGTHRKSCAEEIGMAFATCCKRWRGLTGSDGWGERVPQEAAWAEAWKQELEAGIRGSITEGKEKRQDSANHVLPFSSGR